MSENNYVLKKRKKNKTIGQSILAAWYSTNDGEW